MDPSKILDFIKLSPRYLAAIALITGAMIFLPESALTRLGIARIAGDYKGWLGIGFLASAALLSVSLATIILGKLTQGLASRQRKEHIEERLRSLTEAEKQILRYYFAKRTRSNRLRIDDGTVRGLVFSGIIFRSTDVGNILSGFDHNISDTALNYICDHPEVLNGETNSYRTDRSQWDN
ncbi:superinfection exclusion B family protein [Dyella flagellata]|uniref:Superinfection exclusion protein B n=1 Tax=Dyella flagellata TaxID=1867833 RepID=A0ABQ5XAF4_9GAMM|nr:superinfection exclusion B family protein [Dyella flagellata]GLQ88580.1 hypothetical protein GCM10007898_21500 [Dyella flagellata]